MLEFSNILGFSLVFPQVFSYTYITKGITNALKGVILSMMADQILMLQQAYRDLKEALQSRYITKHSKHRIQSAMEHIQKTLQVQGVFIS
jgi:hypothetical protein